MRAMRFVLGAAVLMLAISRATWAAGFTVSPLRLTLSAAATTSSLTVENNGDEPVLVQSRLMAWSQREGRDMLEDSRELLVSPPIFRIAAGAVQTLRVGLMRPSDPSRQLAYRLLLQEIPPPRKPGQHGVGVALQLSLPVFVAPVAPAAVQLRWEARPVSGELLALTLFNDGNVHLQLLDLKLFLPDGALLAEQDRGAYVLAGQARMWTLKTKRPWTGGALNLSARTDSGVLHRQVGVSP